MRNLNPILEIRDLHTQFHTLDGIAKALNGVTFPVFRGEITGIVGETGSGKSVTALSILRLIEPPGEIFSGEIIFNSKDLLKSTEKELSKIRGKKISMMFQDARSALNPLIKVGYQISRLLRMHHRLTKKEAKKLSIEMLRMVEMPSPEKRAHSFPHELSSGMCQRVMIAMALCGNPQILIADEPTTGLDVTVQAQVLDLIVERVKGSDTSCIFITHDFGIVAEICDWVVVMYAGKVMEHGTVNNIFQNPAHPYTQGLIRSTLRADIKKEIFSIPGTVPDALHIPNGCPFHPRCPFMEEICTQEEPIVTNIGDFHNVYCHIASGVIKPESR